MSYDVARADREVLALGQQLILLVVGFVLTGVAGGVLGAYLQNRAWDHQHDAGRRDGERSRALVTFEEVSRLLDRRLYRMRQLYWAVRQQARGIGDGGAIDQARDSYREIVTEWNDNLNRTLALAEVSFGTPVRTMLEDQVYEEFAAVERGLGDLVSLARAASGRFDMPVFGYRLRELGTLSYALNLRMLRLLQADAIGRAAPPAASAAPSARPLLGLGHEGQAVRELQIALARTGEQVEPDGIFGLRTWAALRSFQNISGLSSDGIAGPLTTAALTSAAAQPGRPG